MERQKLITLLISLLAIVLSAYTLLKINRLSKVNIAAEKSDISSYQVQNTVSDIAISQNRLGGTNAVELRRGNRLDIFGGMGGLGEHLYEPVDYFDLAPIDEAAADKLTAILIVPNVVLPFRPFPISYDVRGPEYALSRVNSYQLNVANAGPIFGLPSLPLFTQDGYKAEGSIISSIWKDGNVKLWAHFGTGIRELKVKNVVVDISDCSTDIEPLEIWRLSLQTVAANKFIEKVEEEAGNDVTVTTLSPAIASYDASGFNFKMALRLANSDGSLDVFLEMKFMLVPQAGNLGASFLQGYKSVVIEADPNFLGDAFYFITLGEHKSYELQNHFSSGLQRLAEDFASTLGRSIRGLPANEDDEEEGEADQSPKIVAASIDEANSSLIVTLCPLTEGLVTISGIFPMNTFKQDSN